MAGDLLHINDSESDFDLFPAKKTHRVLSALADMFLITLLGVLLTVVPFYFAFGYYNDVSEYTTQLNTLNSMSLETHLVAKNDNGSFKSQDDLAYEYVAMEAKQDYYDAEGKEKNRLAYYYVEYKKETISFYNDLFLQIDGVAECYDTSDLSGSVLRINEETRTSLLPYLNGLSSNKEAYNKISGIFKSAYSKAYDDFAANEAYQKEFGKMDSVFSQMKWKGALSAFLGYSISAALFLIILPLWAFSGNTVGKKVLKIKVLDSFGAPLPKWKGVLRGFLVFAIDLFLILPVAYIANWRMTSVNLPIMSIGSFTLTLGFFALFFALVAVIDLAVMLFRADGRFLHDVVTDSYAFTSDPKRIDEEKRIRSMKKQGEGKGEGDGSRL